MPGALILGASVRKSFGHAQKRRCAAALLKQKAYPAYSAANSLPPGTSLLSYRATGQCCLHCDQRRLTCFSSRSSLRSSFGSSAPSPSSIFGSGARGHLSWPAATSSRSATSDGGRPSARRLSSGTSWSTCNIRTASSWPFASASSSAGSGCGSSDTSGMGGSAFGCSSGGAGTNSAIVLSTSPAFLSNSSSRSSSSSGSAGCSAASSSSASSSSTSSPAASNSLRRLAFSSCCNFSSTCFHPASSSVSADRTSNLRGMELASGFGTNTGGGGGGGSRRLAPSPTRTLSREERVAWRPEPPARGRAARCFSSAGSR
mmetsp:Transcript_26018/g.72609  ORF Transcript_26018/g.72609 Transcript_26018/m.72609 type:complete len:316 (-) Transcript_26018:160-1107(-)